MGAKVSANFGQVLRSGSKQVRDYAGGCCASWLVFDNQVPLQDMA